MKKIFLLPIVFSFSLFGSYKERSYVDQLFICLREKRFAEFETLMKKDEAKHFLCFSSSDQRLSYQGDGLLWEVVHQDEATLLPYFYDFMNLDNANQVVWSALKHKKLKCAYALHNKFMINPHHSWFLDSKNPIICLATDAGCADMIQTWVDRGINLNTIKDEVSNTLLHHAAGNNQLDMVRYFVSQGIPVNAKNDGDYTPLHCAAMRSKDSSIIEYLCQSGADVDVQDTDGQTPLHEAVWFVKPLAVKCLLAAGANMNIKRAFGERDETPFEVALALYRQSSLNKYPSEYPSELSAMNEIVDAFKQHAIRTATSTVDYILVDEAKEFTQDALHDVSRRSDKLVADNETEDKKGKSFYCAVQ
ncbi:MAG TPA: ankyrin repeat domain-containing protein [Candidatus Saccharimonadales bacterium]|nr:ankyrin repeat domain-containing protein [Candidatus Saccharimonadales bacterium]